MKIDISLSDWETIDYCMSFAFKFNMNKAYGKGASKEAIETATKINTLKNKLSMQLSTTQIKKRPVKGLFNFILELVYL